MWVPPFFRYFFFWFFANKNLTPFNCAAWQCGLPFLDFFRSNKTWLHSIALPCGVGSPELTKEDHVLVISFDVNTSDSGRLKGILFYFLRKREYPFPLQNKDQPYKREKISVSDKDYLQVYILPIWSILNKRRNQKKGSKCELTLTGCGFQAGATTVEQRKELVCIYQIDDPETIILKWMWWMLWMIFQACVETVKTWRKSSSAWEVPGKYLGPPRKEAQFSWGVIMLIIMIMMMLMFSNHDFHPSCRLVVNIIKCWCRWWQCTCS